MTRPYNLYYTPDGSTAIVMVEQYNTIRFADPHTWKTVHDLKYPGCLGPNHADFSGNGRFFVVTCEFSGELLKIGTLSRCLSRTSGRPSLEGGRFHSSSGPVALAGAVERHTGRAKIDCRCDPSSRPVGTAPHAPGREPP